MWCYDIGTNTWNVKANMLQPRADHCMEAHKGRLYVAGGWRDHAVTGNRVILDNLDCFSPETNQWDTISLLPNATYRCGMVVLNACLYITGGLQHSGFNGASKKISVFNFETNHWQEKDYPVEIWEHLSCVLYIPLHSFVLQNDSDCAESQC